MIIRHRFKTAHFLRSANKWSHGVAAVETVGRADLPSTLNLLQWSHGVAAVETTSP